MNNYFCTIGDSLQKNITCSSTAYQSYMPPSPKDSMFCTPVSAAEIYEIINKMKNNKSPGVVACCTNMHKLHIGPRLLKEITPFVVPTTFTLYI